jgi:hypothetical protein
MAIALFVEIMVRDRMFTPRIFDNELLLLPVHLRFHEYYFKRDRDHSPHNPLSFTFASIVT